MTPVSTPTRLNTARDSIGRFAPILARLQITEAFDYAAREVSCPATAYLETLASIESRRNMGYALDIFAAFLSGGRLSREQIPWHELTAEHRDAVRRHLVERYEESAARGRRQSNPLSVNNRLSAWRQVLKHAWDKGLMSAEKFQRASAVQGVLGERLQKRRFVGEDALARVFQSCALDANRVAGARDAAILALYFGCGLRRFEALSLLLEDIDGRAEGWLVTVLGKRNKERVVGIPIGAAAFVRDWLEHRGRETGPLFYPVRKNGVIAVQDRPMSTKVGNNIVQRRLQAAGLPRFSPHDLRATSTTILAGLLDVFQTMDWAGHDDANTTRGYVASARGLAHEIAARLHVPHFSEAGAPTRLSWEELRGALARPPEDG